MRQRIFLGGQAVSMLGDGLAVLAIPLLVLRVTSSPEAAVLASLPGGVGYLVAGIPAGVAADRLDPWLVLGASDVLRALHLGPALVGLVVTAGGVGGLLGAIATSALCRRLGPLPVVAGCAAASGVALILIGTAAGLPVLLAANLLYTWAIIAASVTLRALRQALVPRPLLGRVTAAWRLGGQGVTLAGAVLAGAATALLAGDPPPVLAAAGLLTILCTAVAWLAALRQEDRAGVALAVLGPSSGPGHNDLRSLPSEDGRKGCTVRMHVHAAL